MTFNFRKFKREYASVYICLFYLHTYTHNPKLMSIPSSSSWSDAEQWIVHTLVPHLHQSPALRLVGLLRLQYTHAHSPLASVFLGDSVVTSQLVLPDLHMADWSTKQ